MYPVLIVEGVAHKEISIKWKENGIESVSFYDGNNKFQTIYDVTSTFEDEGQLDLNQAIQWHGRYDELHKEIEKEIKFKESTMVALAIENMHNQQPFTPSDIQKKYFDLLNQQVGLMDAQEVIENFMEEDVDLSGGEDIAIE